jgi:hypothetical protein
MCMTEIEKRDSLTDKPREFLDGMFACLRLRVCHKNEKS